MRGFASLLVLPLCACLSRTEVGLVPPDAGCIECDASGAQDAGLLLNLEHFLAQLEGKWTGEVRTFGGAQAIQLDFGRGTYQVWCTNPKLDANPLPDGGSACFPFFSPSVTSGHAGTFELLPTRFGDEYEAVVQDGDSRTHVELQRMVVSANTLSFERVESGTFPLELKSEISLKRVAHF